MTVVFSLETLEGWLVKHKVAPSTFGALAMGDPRFVSELRRGRSVSVKTWQRAFRWMQKFEGGKIQGRKEWRSARRKYKPSSQRAEEIGQAEYLAHRKAMAAGSKKLLDAIMREAGLV